MAARSPHHENRRIVEQPVEDAQKRAWACALTQASRLATDRGVRPARDRRVAAREAGRTVQGDAAGAFRAALREGIDRPVHAVQKEGLAPEARRRARGRDHGPYRPQRRLARDGRREHAAGNGGKGAVV